MSVEVVGEREVVVWWGDSALGVVDVMVVEGVYQQVLYGLGLVVVLSGDLSLIFGASGSFLFFPVANSHSPCKIT